MGMEWKIVGIETWMSIPLSNWFIRYYKPQPRYPMNKWVINHGHSVFAICGAPSRPKGYVFVLG
jgi:hypothetical protein